MALVTIDQFRKDFTEFSNTAKYPNDGVQFWLTFADKMLINPLRWGDVRNMGIELFVAHNLALENQAQKASKAGGTPGLQMGVLTGKTVGPVSANYDANAGLELGAGHWNLTTYGTRFLRLARMIGAGPIQV